MLGFLLPAYDRSLRKQQLKASKFYLFDLGVKRTLDRTIQLTPETGQQIGPLFEHFLITEIFRLNHYLRKYYVLSHVATKGGLEIDLVIERPGLKTAIVEIKSTDRVTDQHLRHLKAIKSEYPEFESYCLCQESLPRNVDGIHVLPWQRGLVELGFDY